MSAQQQQPRKFTCYRCQQEIKLKRKPDNSGWIRLDLNGTTEHNCKKQQQTKEQDKQQQQQPPTTSGNNNTTTTTTTTAEGGGEEG